MNNKEILKKKIIYRSKHRGSKEMDLLLGSFVEKYINSFDISDLNDLVLLLLVEDLEDDMIGILAKVKKVLFVNQTYLFCLRNLKL